MGLILGIYIAVIFIIVVCCKDFISMWFFDNSCPLVTKVVASLFFVSAIIGTFITIVAVVVN